jgi:hypothetical protein
MPTVLFTSTLQRFLPVPSARVTGATIAQALAAVFASEPRLRGYVLDDQGALRRHVAIYVNGRPITSGVAGGEQPGINSVLIDPCNPSDIRIGVSSAGMWASTDTGATWQIINHGMYNEYMPPERREDPILQDIHLLSRCAGHPEIVWCQHHNGVFRSENAGADWHELTAICPSKFGFAVAAHPRDPDTAWFVPAIKDERRVPVDGKVVVARTRDGGRSFEVLKNGLPQRHAYDLVWRHALAVDETGELLAFGSTSGGLWISENGGDTWTMPEARLPPIAAVRFAPALH